MISRCSSPMPAMIVCPVSSSVRTRNDGSSIASFCSDAPSLSWSALVLGSIAMSMTGSGNSIRSRMIGCFSSQSVSPVVALLRPTTAQMSPARHSLDLFALVGAHLHQAADALSLALRRCCRRSVPASSRPE